MTSPQLTEAKLKPLVTIAGSAKNSTIGPPLGRVDIGVNGCAYIFRVALPGVRGNANRLKCNIERNGRVAIEGVISESQFLRGSSKVFEMEVQELCPAGPFTVSFNLPEPVDPRLCSLSFKPGGILEVVVFKTRVPGLSADGLFERWL